MPPVVSRGVVGAAGVVPGKAGGVAGAVIGCEFESGRTISMPIEVPPEDGDPLVTAGAPAAVLAGTSWNVSGAAGGVGAADPSAAAGVPAALDAATGAVLAAGFIEVLKSAMDLRTTAAALTGLVSSRGGAPMVAAGTVSA